MTTITVPRALIEQALEAVLELEYSATTAVADGKARKAKQALRAALAQQAEPQPKFPRAMFEYVKGDNMDEWRKNLSQEFWAMGDARLAWISEGDAVMAQLKHQMAKENSNG